MASQDRQMGFLIRIMLFLGIVILFIPADEAETKKLGSNQSLSLFDTFGFATAASSDAAGFCDRNHPACATGGTFVGLFEAKARTGAHWVLGYLEPRQTPDAKTPDAKTPDATTSGQQPAASLATGSLSRRTTVSSDEAAGVTTVSIQPRAHGGFLPLPPARRPS